MSEADREKYLILLREYYAGLRRQRELTEEMVKLVRTKQDEEWVYAQQWPYYTEAMNEK